eukprot:SAG22_NODE_152_length_17377_cov_191.856928_24_plen_199_part_00
MLRLHLAPPELAAAAGPVAAAAGLRLEHAAAAPAKNAPAPAVALCHWAGDTVPACCRLLADFARTSPQTFTVAVGPALGDDPAARLAAFDAGAKMVAPDLASLPALLRRIRSQFEEEEEEEDTDDDDDTSEPRRRYQCPRCGLSGLTEAGLHTHDPLYHGTAPNVGGVCQIWWARVEHFVLPFLPFRSLRLSALPLPC